MKRRTFSFILFLLCAVGAMAEDGEKQAVVRLETSKGVIRIALFDDTPLHRDNFIHLVETGFYDGIPFHRVIQDFMIQAGDPECRVSQDGQNVTEELLDYTLPAEILFPEHPHLRGAVAAAREGDSENPERRSSGTQFYIVWGKKMHPMIIEQMKDDLAKKGVELSPEMIELYARRGGALHLDGQYTVFGEVIDGMDVVDEIQRTATDEKDRPIEDVVIVKATMEPQEEN